MNSALLLMERESELALLDGVLAEVKTGGKVVLVRGESGIGKTALLRKFLDGNADRAHVLLGRCDDLLTPQPLAPFRDMARQEPSLAEGLEKTNRLLVMETCLDLLERSLRPTIMVIEDTQWADEATLDVINFLGRRAAQTRGLLVLTYRDGEVDLEHPLRRVIGGFASHDILRIRLRGLSQEAVSSLISGSSLDSEEVYAATDGNPLLTIEMASMEDEKLPASVQDSVMARVGKLSERAQEMLRLLSVIPAQVSRLEVELLTHGGDAELAECERRDLVDVEGDYVAFRHELIRNVVEASLTGSERLAANRRVLELSPPTADPARLVHHARQANDADRLIELAPRAARAAMSVGSHGQAVEHFRQLAPYLDRLDPENKGPILDEWADEESFTHQPSEAVRLNELALAHYRMRGDRKGESAALAAAAYFQEWGGHRGLAERYAHEAVDFLGPNPDGPDLARALEASAFLAMMAEDAAAALTLVDRIMEVAGPDIDEKLLVRVLVLKGSALNTIHYPDGKEILDEARRRAENAGAWRELVRAIINHAAAAVDNRDLSIASDYAQQGILMAAACGSWTCESLAKASHAEILDLRGDWSQAEDTARALLDAHPLARRMALGLLGRIEVRSGRITARETVQQAWETAVASGELQHKTPAAALLAEYAWITGDPDIPLAEIKEVMWRRLDISSHWPAASIAFWLWKLGELPEIPGRIPEPYRLVMTGEPLVASTLWAELGCPYERAIALTHGDTGARREALEILETLGATAVAAKLRRQLREEGVTVPRGRAHETRRHPIGLTARQSEVLALLGEHLSNVEIADRLFLSPRTVEHHVAGLMSKLSASTRDEAVATAAEVGLLAVG